MDATVRCRRAVRPTSGLSRRCESARRVHACRGRRRAGRVQRVDRSSVSLSMTSMPTATATSSAAGTSISTRAWMSEWERIDVADQIGTVVDAMLMTDVDGDDHADIIATSLPDVWWIESDENGSWNGRIVSMFQRPLAPTARGTDSVISTETNATRSCSRGGNDSEVWYVDVPDDPANATWPAVRVTDTATDEQVGIGDIDGDGVNDMVAGDMKDGGSFIAWFENPGDGSSDWVRHRLVGSWSVPGSRRCRRSRWRRSTRRRRHRGERRLVSRCRRDVYRQPDDPKS